MLGRIWGRARELLAGRELGDPISLREALRIEGCRVAERVVREARVLGVYELIIEAARMGCKVSLEYLEEALAFTVLAGEGKWAWEASRLLGKPLPKGGVVYAYCSGESVEVLAGDILFSTSSLPASASWRIVGGDAISSAALALGAEVLAYWGCRPTYPWSVDVRMLASIAIPEGGGMLYSTAYHLGVSYRRPVEAVKGVAERSVWILERLGVDWRRMPQSVSRASAIKASHPEPLEGGLVLTDKPRLVYGVTKPYRLDPGPPRGEGLAYAAWAAAASIALRKGDIARILYRDPQSLGGRFWSLLENIVSSSIEKGTAIAPQVEPWDTGLVNGGASDGVAEVDCLRPLEDCLEPEGHGPWVEGALRRGFNLPLPPPPSRPGRVRVRTWLPSSYASRLGVESGGGEPRIVALTPESPGPEDLAGKALSLASGERPLIVAPSRALAIEISKAVRARLLERPESAEEWLASGGIAVAWWEMVISTPEVLGPATSIVLVLPEVLVRGGRKASRIVAALRGEEEEYYLRDYWLDKVKELVAKLGGRAVSYSLSEPKGWKRPRGRIGNELVKDEVLLAFTSIMRGARPRKGQETALAAVSRSYLEGRPLTTMAILPTGYGKSAIFQAAGRAGSLMGWGVYTLVVSPLKALMRDQARSAAKRGLAAAYIDSSVPARLKRLVVDAARRGLLDLVYVAPERFGDNDLESLLETTPPSLAVLDEAHSLARWGVTFRPSYLYMAKRLLEIRSSRLWPPILALTATATPDVADSVMLALGSQNRVEVGWDVGWDEAWRAASSGDVIVRGDPVRDNIEFHIVPAPRDDKARVETVARLVSDLSKWADGVSEDGWVGVVFTGYVKSRRRPRLNAEEIAGSLKSSGVEKVYVYHGQMAESMRRKVEREVIEGGGRRVIVATKAFGMGVDIPNIRWIIHVSPSDSLEDYVQEAGRAGRDGLRSIAAILYNPEDFKVKAVETLSELPKPSEVVAVNNILAATSKSLGIRRILVPLKALPRGRIALRSLDFLRSSGVLDYWLVGKAQLYEARSDIPLEEEAGWAVRLPGDLAFSTPGLPRVEGLRPLKFRFESCNGGLRLVADGEEVFSAGACSGEWRQVEPGSHYVIVEWAPGYEPIEVDILGRELFSALHTRRSIEIRRLEALRDAIEVSLSLASKGVKEVDRAFKDAIRKYFSTPMKSLKGTLPPGGSIECSSVRGCRELAELLGVLEDLLGPEGVYLAVSSERLLKEVAEAYRSMWGKPFKARSGSLLRIVRLAEKGEWAKLMDLGYIVAVCERSRIASRALKALKEYPYARLYVTRI
ncbi:MAG: DEAD/DEAH box helicase [Desulfurococcales archaeon]|nr:DEAD/DEAH box helicase [Desulfurococcales archaeon]